VNYRDRKLIRDRDR